jgi:hypothetical protein
MLNDCVLFPVNAGFKEAFDRIHEIIAVKLSMEADNTRSQHSLQEFLTPWTDPEPLRIRPWNVPEHDDCRPRKALSNQLRNKGKVVVLNEDDGIV